jgi:ADP-ribose pyrophosphatase YjhB (NUDIX family)
MIKQKTRQSEDSRFAVDTKGLTSFMQILEHIDDTRNGKELFPRPSKTADPLQSYGIILFIRDEMSIHYFACQRRTTVEFSEIVKCGPRKDKLYQYFCNMTDFERNLLCEQPHDKLWDDLLLSEMSLFNDTRMKVAAIHKAYKPYLRDLLSLTKSITDEPPFEFPKGRSNQQQDKTLLGTALRELKEEAGIDLGTSVELMDDISVVDSYKGTDGIKYQTTYFLVRSPEFFEPEFQYFDYENCIEEYCISKDMHDGKWIELPLFEKPQKGSTPLCDRLESLLFKIHAKLCSTQGGV